MDIQAISRYKSSFDQIVNHIGNDKGGEQIEVWFARDLQSVLGYARWENFVVAIKPLLNHVDLRISILMTIFVRSRKWFIWVAVRNAKCKTLC